MTTVAEDEVLSAVELDLTAGSITDDAEAASVEPAAAEASTAPLIRVERGNPSDADIAALVCVFTAAAAAGAAAPGEQGPLDRWGRPALLHRGAAPFSPYAFPALAYGRD
ncbi:acyl-CoA carboxylase subunit epsilon [Nocardia harenae]|uniref:acyl-CoA carboxylase subunit epsilon n=1 Tax=Nocardia harenae TaxID=358707 RepID=UPI00083379A8|nr:acyl-CoA carboxylase subunit epsilon [Nocardia harenae]